MEFPALKEAQGKLDAKNKELFDIFQEAGPQRDMNLVKSISGDSAAKVAHIQALDKEINDLADGLEKLKAVHGIADRFREQRNGSGEPGSDGEPKRGGDGAQLKSVGELFTASAAYKKRSGQNGPEANLDVELKTLFQTTDGWLPETTRTGRVVDFATRPIQVIDLIPMGNTSQAAVVYMEETVFTNNAAEVAEGNPYGESRLKLDEVTEPVRTIGTWIPVTDTQLEDEPQARGYINNRLPFMLRQRLDSQILVGNGTAPNLRGFLNRTGIQTQAKGADPTPDAFYKAMTKVQVTGQAMPSAHFMHPNDWQEIRLLRTADGIYIWGSPSETGPARMWGLPVATVQAITEGTGLTGDFQNFTELTMRRGVDVQVSNSHNDFFTSAKQAIRADIRAALCVYRAAALCTVTGI